MRAESFVDLYLAHLRVERGLSANTLAAYGSDLAAFVEFCRAAGTDDLRRADLAVVTSYSSSLAKAGLSARSTARKLSSVRGFMRFLVSEGELAEDPTALAPRPKIGRRLPRPLTTEEIICLIHAPSETTLRGLRDRALLSLAYAAGLRVSELVRLELGDLDFRRGVVSAFGKGQKRRLVPVGEVALGHLEAYRAALSTAPRRTRRTAPNAERLLFPSPSGRPLTRQTFWHIVKRAALAAGLADRVHPHRLRHSFATHLLVGGADLRSVQAMLGHADVSTTEIYTQVTRDHVRKTHARTHPRA